MNNPRPLHRLCVVCALLASLLLALLPAAVGVPLQAQSPDSAWTTPVNLSTSGAASLPVIAAYRDTLQVYWWDQFEGLTVATRTGTTWSAPLFVTIPAIEVEQGPPAKPGTPVMPTLCTDVQGFVHAFWIGEPDKDTEHEPLLYSRVTIGATDWLTPTVIVESVSIFEATAAPDGSVLLAFVRPSDTPEEPAGYYVQTLSPASDWGAPALISATRYVRLLSPEDTLLSVLQTADGGRHLVWEDPRTGRAMYAHTAGSAWTVPEPLGLDDEYARVPRLAALSSGALLRIYEAGPSGFCRLLQQRSPAIDSPGSKTAGFAWGSALRVLPQLQRCPEGGDRFWSTNGQLLWMWGLNTGQLAAAGYDPTASEWSDPRTLDLRMRNSEDDTWLYWSQLDVQLYDGALQVAGIDAVSGDVWFAAGRLSALDIAFGATSPWSDPASPIEGTDATAPSIAVDPQGQLHMVWLQQRDDSTDTTLLYANVSLGSRPIAVFTAPSDELVRQPTLLADQAGILHLAWSGETAGQIVYARARATEAGSLGWSEPVVLTPDATSAAWPQLALDAVGRLYLLYIVPTNEGRGLYLTRSLDGGATWTMPTNVFDAQGYGWVAVDHPTLVVSPDGQVHMAWANVGVAANLGVYYAQAEWADREGLLDGGFFIWNEPRQLADAGHDWPRLALTGERLHLVYASLSDNALWQTAGDVADIYTGTYFATASRLSGWDATALPFGLTEVGGTLHLVGLDTAGELLYHSVLEPSETATERWTDPEKLVLGPGYWGAESAQASAPRQGGVLGVALGVLAGDQRGDAIPAVLSVARLLPTVDPALLDTPILAPSATPTPAETATLAPTPVATLDLSGPTPAEKGATSRSLLIGAGIGAVVVVLGAWLRYRTRSR